MTAKIKAHLTGTKPLLMKNGMMASPLHPLAQELSALTKKRNKTVDDYRAIAEVEYKGALYWDDIVGPFIPADNVFRSFIKGGGRHKLGSTIERSLFIVEDVLKLRYDGPRTIDGLLEDGRFRHEAIVKVGQSKTLRTRPQFPEWSLEAVFELDEDELDLHALMTPLKDAGKYVGLGDWRPRYGTYHIEIEKL